MACLALTAGAAAHQQRPSDIAVKAAYLLNFARFAEWPADPIDVAASFVVCVLGRDPIEAALEAATAGQRIGGRAVTTRHMADMPEIAGCRMLFIAASERARVKRAVESAEAQHVLTVSDMPGFLDQDGMIEFLSQGTRVRFAVNLDAASRAGVRLGSEMLRVAARVEGSGRQ